VVVDVIVGRVVDSLAVSWLAACVSSVVVEDKVGKEAIKCCAFWKEERN